MCPCTTHILTPHLVIHHVYVEIQLLSIFGFERSGFQFHHYVGVKFDVVQDKVCIGITAAYLKMLLSGDKGKSVSHFQQILCDVLCQLLFNVSSSADSLAFAMSNI